jgi:hypothetical protein
MMLIGFSGLAFAGFRRANAGHPTRAHREEAHKAS